MGTFATMRAVPLNASISPTLDDIERRLRRSMVGGAWSREVENKAFLTVTGFLLRHAR
jgi:hypothetical protein